MTRLYVAGPMSGIEGHNFPAFNTAAAQLRDAGYEVENPADTGVVEGWSWADYLRYDLPLMLRCEGVALLTGWFHSKGARLEIDVAERLGMQVRVVRVWLERAEVAA